MMIVTTLELLPHLELLCGPFLRNATLIDLVIVVDSHRAIKKLLIAKVVA